MRSPWTVLQILFISAATCIYMILHGNKIKQYLKDYKATKFLKTILENTYKVVLGTYKLAASTRLLFVLPFWRLLFQK